MKVLFLYLKAFSFTGGIEKFNRSFLKAIHELSVDGFCDATAFSSHDTITDEKYFPRNRFKGFGGDRIYFAFSSLVKSYKFDVVVIGHINLSVIGRLIKKLRPSIKLVVIAHGIEVWKTHTGHKRKLLDSADIILSVSQFTKDKIIEFNPTINPDKIKIFPNTIDPYFDAPTSFKKPAYLLERYHLDTNAQIIITVTRLSFSEKYKGYDSTIKLMNKIVEANPKVHYLICGKADKNESDRVIEMISNNNVGNEITLTGFIKDEELIDHYLLGDVFVMPSKKEGFGIVFIEAMACGLKVIAGSKDGSVDALKNGELGMLIDPDSKEELEVAIQQSLNNTNHDPLSIQQKVYDAFGFHRYKERIKTFLADDSNQ
ncbi:MAG: glycosyltransferase family 4 protein [Chitinophagaceae bacterium]|nr:glycosyltransferase family 4 protein [Chitinophagaceae bacterium]